MKICVIGGGSTYTPELISGFINLSDQLPVDEICLMDIDPYRLDSVGGFIERYCATKKVNFKVSKTDILEFAIQGASYVITQVRVGMMNARKNDEYLGKKYGIIGQETTGIGGMAKAIRTIPVILEVANTIRKVAPKAVLINFSNPSGLVTEALQTFAPDVISVGLCNAPYHAKMKFLDIFQQATNQTIDPSRAQLNTLGLNHLSWNRGLFIDGKDEWQIVLKHFLQQLKTVSNPEWDPKLIENLGMVPNNYLHYYYDTNKMLALQEEWPPSRAETVQMVEQELLRDYSNSEKVDLPEGLMSRGGAYYSTVATQLINSHFNQLSNIHIVNTRQNNAVPGIAEDWVMEMPCIVDDRGFTPIPTSPLPLSVSGLMTQIKSYEKLTAIAAVTGNRQMLYQAILTHPLGPNVDKIPDMINDLLEINKPLLPNFWS